MRQDLNWKGGCQLSVLSWCWMWSRIWINTDLGANYRTKIRLPMVIFSANFWCLYIVPNLSNCPIRLKTWFMEKVESPLVFFKNWEVRKLENFKKSLKQLLHLCYSTLTCKVTLLNMFKRATFLKSMTILIWIGSSEKEAPHTEHLSHLELQRSLEQLKFD